MQEPDRSDIIKSPLPAEDQEENGDLSVSEKVEEIIELSSNVSMDVPQRTMSTSPPRNLVIKPRTSSLREKTLEVFTVPDFEHLSSCFLSFLHRDSILTLHLAPEHIRLTTASRSGSVDRD
jgi:hypothetical protein